MKNIVKLQLSVPKNLMAELDSLTKSEGHPSKKSTLRDALKIYAFFEEAKRKGATIQLREAGKKGDQIINIEIL